MHILLKMEKDYTLEEIKKKYDDKVEKFNRDYFFMIHGFKAWQINERKKPYQTKIRNIRRKMYVRRYVRNSAFEVK